MRKITPVTSHQALLCLQTTSLVLPFLKMTKLLIVPAMSRTPDQKSLNTPVDTYFLPFMLACVSSVPLLKFLVSSGDDTCIHT